MFLFSDKLQLFGCCLHVVTCRICRYGSPISTHDQMKATETNWTKSTPDFVHPQYHQTSLEMIYKLLSPPVAREPAAVITKPKRHNPHGEHSTMALPHSDSPEDWFPVNYQSDSDEGRSKGDSSRSNFPVLLLRNLPFQGNNWKDE